MKSNDLFTAKQIKQVEALREIEYEPCKVCGGKLISIITYSYGHGGIIFGGAPPTPFLNGQYCEECGIQYFKAKRVNNEDQ